MASIQKLSNGRYRARYRDASGKEHLHRAKLKKDAQVWLDRETAKLESGTWVAPRTARTTVGQWCDTWLAIYADEEAVDGTHGPRSRRQDQSRVRIQAS